ncbi:Retrotransposon protein [Seminavis robusta]|uniref:Retrotransposon protein n=1 Tax=Seminavis robusta TaxID=568900 RepID=A0A9N8ECR8_9STRA|nr:Retrotransposon protein [Seminavis robusta]|eukprot:Sro808_g205470.1 Retrotransposon protein (288) ;mRNA; r:37498-38566
MDPGWGVQGTAFLGYWLAPTTSIRPRKKKIDAILQLETPKDVKELCCFLGDVSFYRDRFPQCHPFLAPLYNLTSTKTNSFAWTTECQHAFDVIKGVLARDSLFVHHNAPFLVFQADARARETQCGAVIVVPKGKKHCRKDLPPRMWLLLQGSALVLGPTRMVSATLPLWLEWSILMRMRRKRMKPWSMDLYQAGIHRINKVAQTRQIQFTHCTDAPMLRPNQSRRKHLDGMTKLCSECQLVDPIMNKRFFADDVQDVQSACNATAAQHWQLKVHLVSHYGVLSLTSF